MEAPRARLASSNGSQDVVQRLGQLAKVELVEALQSAAGADLATMLRFEPVVNEVCLQVQDVFRQAIQKRLLPEASKVLGARAGAALSTALLALQTQPGSLGVTTPGEPGTLHHDSGDDILALAFAPGNGQTLRLDQGPPLGLQAHAQLEPAGPVEAAPHTSPAEQQQHLHPHQSRFSFAKDGQPQGQPRNASTSSGGAPAHPAHHEQDASDLLSSSLPSSLAADLLGQPGGEAGAPDKRTSSAGGAPAASLAPGASAAAARQLAPVGSLLATDASPPAAITRQLAQLNTTTPASSQLPAGLQPTNPSQPPFGGQGPAGMAAGAPGLNLLNSSLQSGPGGLGGATVGAAAPSPMFGGAPGPNPGGNLAQQQQAQQQQRLQQQLLQQAMLGGGLGGLAGNAAAWQQQQAQAQQQAAQQQAQQQWGQQLPPRGAPSPYPGGLSALQQQQLGLALGGVEGLGSYYQSATGGSFTSPALLDPARASAADRSLLGTLQQQLILQEQQQQLLLQQQLLQQGESALQYLQGAQGLPPRPGPSPGNGPGMGMSGGYGAGGAGGLGNGALGLRGMGLDAAAAGGLDEATASQLLADYGALFMQGGAGAGSFGGAAGLLGDLRNNPALGGGKELPGMPAGGGAGQYAPGGGVNGMSHQHQHMGVVPHPLQPHPQQGGAPPSFARNSRSGAPSSAADSRSSSFSGRAGSVSGGPGLLGPGAVPSPPVSDASGPAVSKQLSMAAKLQQPGGTLAQMGLAPSGLGPYGGQVKAPSDLPGRFRCLPPAVQARIHALTRENQVVLIKDFDEKVLSKMTLLVDKFGTAECLAMLDRIEEVLKGKAGRLANGPGYLDVSVSTRLDELKQRASGQVTAPEDYARSTLHSRIYSELRDLIARHGFLHWHHFDQGIINMLKKMPNNVAIERLNELAYHSFKNVDNPKSCIVSIFTTKPKYVAV